MGYSHFVQISCAKISETQLEQKLKTIWAKALLIISNNLVWKYDLFLWNLYIFYNTNLQYHTTKLILLIIMW